MAPGTPTGEEGPSGHRRPGPMRPNTPPKNRGRTPAKGAVARQTHPRVERERHQDLEGVWVRWVHLRLHRGGGHTAHGNPPGPSGPGHHGGWGSDHVRGGQRGCSGTTTLHSDRGERGMHRGLEGRHGGAVAPTLPPTGGVGDSVGTASRRNRCRWKPGTAESPIQAWDDREWATLRSIGPRCRVSALAGPERQNRPTPLIYPAGMVRQNLSVQASARAQSVQKNRAAASRTGWRGSTLAKHGTAKPVRGGGPWGRDVPRAPGILRQPIRGQDATEYNIRARGWATRGRAGPSDRGAWRHPQGAQAGSQ